MWAYLTRRFLYMVLLILVTSMVSFVIIQLPAGDYITTLAVRYAATGQVVEQEVLDALRIQFGLDQPVYIQYFKWFTNVLQGDLGWSFQQVRPVSELVAERIGVTALISVCSLTFAYVVGILIGVVSAVFQYSVLDYFFTIVGFLGLASPNFLLALILMVIIFNAGGAVGGLYSTEYLNAPWSWAKFLDLLKHIPLPMIIVGTAGTAGVARVMRATLLDELQKQYVVTARSKGVAEIRLLFKYPIRVALNPITSTIGWELPAIVSGTVITDMVLQLPTVGPMLFSALVAEDMFIASSLLLFLTSLTVIGTFVSDMLLYSLDPRIRVNKPALPRPCPTDPSDVRLRTDCHRHGQCRQPRAGKLLSRVAVAVDLAALPPASPSHGRYGHSGDPVHLRHPGGVHRPLQHGHALPGSHLPSPDAHPVCARGTVATAVRLRNDQGKGQLHAGTEIHR